MIRVALVVGMLTLLPAVAQAERPGAIAMQPDTAIGFVLEKTDGALPVFVGDGDRLTRTAYWIHLRGGVVRPNATTDRGSQLGVAYQLRLGITPSDTPSGDDAPFGAGAQVEIVHRTYTFQWPTDGMLAFHAGAALDFGGGHWWSSGPRFTFLGGFRLAMAPADGAGFEIDYTLVPFVFGATPGALDVSRTEHRWSTTIRAGAVGIGLWVTWFVERFRPEAMAATTRTTGTIIGVGVEWR